MLHFKRSISSPSGGIRSVNSGFTWLHLQIPEEDGQLSSSEGSTVDLRVPGEGGESLDIELEESVDPDGCFTDGE